jgi:shikimate 5-dehydrogenase
MSARDIAAALAMLQRQAERLTVCHRNPEKFHEDKSELVAALARLRRQLEGS